MARRIAHRAQAAHRQARDRALPAGAVVALEQLPQLGQVERLPRRAVAAPVGVEPDRAPLRHDDEHVAQRPHLLDVRRARPALVGVAAAVQEIQHRPAARSAVGLPAVRREQPDHRRRAQRGRADVEVDDPRGDPLLMEDGRAAGGAIGLSASATRRGDQRRAQERYRLSPNRGAQKGILPRPLRPELPLLWIAFWLERNGLPSHSPSLPGALPVTLVGAPAALEPPRSGPRESRGRRKARISRTTQKPATMAMVMGPPYPAVAAISRSRARAARRRPRAPRRALPRRPAAPRAARGPRARRARRSAPPRRRPSA